MSSLSNIGNLMYLYLDYIKPVKQVTVSEFIITATANLINKTNQRNWLPLIVKKTGQNQYEIVANSWIYAVAQKAGLERVWCIIADHNPETQEIAQILAFEQTPKINLSLASKTEISEAIAYLLQLSNSPLKGINKKLFIDRLSQAPRKYLQDLNHISRLKCGIKQGSKLNGLKQVFYLTPEPIPDDCQDQKVLEIFTSNELKQMAKKRGLKGYSKLTKTKLINLLT